MTVGDLRKALARYSDGQKIEFYTALREEAEIASVYEEDGACIIDLEPMDAEDDDST